MTMQGFGWRYRIRLPWQARYHAHDLYADGRMVPCRSRRCIFVAKQPCEACEGTGVASSTEDPWGLCRVCRGRGKVRW